VVTGAGSGIGRATALNTPDDLAKAAVFLASDDAAMITGTCIEVDGGRCI
jgi:3-oxoacyl-[acyl-carrier protein] reductase